MEQRKIYDLIFGYEFYWGRNLSHAFTFTRVPPASSLEGHCVGPCVYDCSKTQLLVLGSKPEDDAAAGSIDNAILHDRLFVLHHVTDKHRRCSDTILHFGVPVAQEQTPLD